jgi:hypothetical protein
LSPRRALAAAAAGVLLGLLLWRSDPRQLSLRAATLARSAGAELEVRRLHGSGASFDRDFFAFLESVKRRLPAGSPGVAIFGKPASDQVLYQAAYVLAPVPVLVVPERVPTGWLLAVFGPERPPGWKVIAPAWKGAVLAPGP